MVQRTMEKTNTAPSGAPGIAIRPRLVIPIAEIRFRFSRSGGAGGQHVNKVSTRVQLLFDVAGSPSLTEDQRRMLVGRLGSRIDADGMLSVVADTARSQWKNREEALARFADLLRRALVRRKRRKPTRTPASAHEERLKQKRHRSWTKAQRGGRDIV